MKARPYFQMWLAAFVVITVGNLGFHGFIASAWFGGNLEKAGGASMGATPDPRMVGTLLFLYVMIAAAQVYWMLPRIERSPSSASVLRDGALFRLTTDGMWHVANTVVFAGWTWVFVAQDMVFNLLSG